MTAAGWWSNTYVIQEIKLSAAIQGFAVLLRFLAIPAVFAVELLANREDAKAAQNLDLHGESGRASRRILLQRSSYVNLALADTVSQIAPVRSALCGKTEPPTVGLARYTILGTSRRKSLT
jgi:hypothetical protein